MTKRAEINQIIIWITSPEHRMSYQKQKSDTSSTIVCKERKNTKNKNHYKKVSEILLKIKC